MSFLRLKEPIYVKGPVSLLPGKKMTNNDLIEWMDNCTLPSSAIGHTSGIQTRYWVKDDYFCSDLAVDIAEKLFTLKPEEKKEQIAQLILATSSGDYISPPTSPLVQHRLGLKQIGAFDLSAACAGFVTGLHTGGALAVAIQKSVLLISAEIRSKFLNPKDFSTSSLFGDGAAACFISRDSYQAEFKLIASQLFSDGEVGDAVCIPSGGSRLPGAVCSQQEKFYLTMKNGVGLFVKAVDGVANLVEEFLQNIEINLQEIDWLVLQQANLHLMLAIAKKLNFPEEKMVIIVQSIGNTSGASVGIALSELVRSTQLKAGEKVMLVGIGGGGLGACALLEVNREINTCEERENE